MTKLEIVQRIAGNHNRLANIMVSGDNAIMMGETLRDLRALVQELQQDVEAELAEEAQKEAETQGEAVSEEK